ncbi:class I adenylate-forming enzyme family protein [Ferrovum sp.]|uniref:class I adenylate-forming enzyme family protein n=1 Tax=Ferrovum sp. TaxID=2609467 RepID=UPI002621D865|nr:AMP-binding protein [Ferrovum sp.]
MIHLKAIREHAALSPSRAAVVTANSHMSWLELQIKTESKIRFLLTQFGTNLPTQACYILPNRTELLPWLAAFVTLGIPVTGLDYTLPLATLRKLATVIGADLLLVSTTALDYGDGPLEIGTPGSLHLDLDSPTHVYTATTDTSSSVDILEDVRSLGIEQQRPYCSVGLTSGTSGLPKPVIRRGSFDQRRFAYFTQHYGFSREDRFLVSMPLYHAAGNGWARLFMSLGATLYFASADAPEELAKAIPRYGITASVMVPYLLDAVIDTLGGRAVTLRWVLVGGKHFPPSQKQRALEKLGPVIYEYYGTTETGVNTIAEPDDLARYPASVGRAYDGNMIAVVDAACRPLGPREAGTVAIASYMNMSHYGDGSANEIFIDGDRYLLTPDQGYLDGEGRLYLLNRSARPDNHSHLYRLEDAIRYMPCIADVALLQSDDQDGSKIDCVISLRAHAQETPQLHHRLQALAAEEFLQLARCRVAPRIPYSPSGKVRASDLQLLLSDIHIL